ncbi:MAG: hypothetical protein R3213_02835, partial [Flavobacteriaceae bacterium]|nr:hypothetical protein [Flavobacteriaceae bacterium]
MTYKFSLILLAFLCQCTLIFPQGSESFSNFNIPGGSYETGSFTGDGGRVWNYSQARTVTTNHNITGTSMGFAIDGSRFVRSTSGVNGVGRLTYKVRSYFSGGGAADRKIEVYINGVLQDSYTLAAMNTVYERSLTANISGDVSIEFRSVGTLQIVLDDITWTAYTPSPSIGVSPTTIESLNYLAGSGPSTTQTFSVDGTQLLSDIVMSASTNFEISLNAAGPFFNTLNLSPSSGTVSPRTIFVRLKQGLVAGEYNGSVTATSNMATTRTLTLKGNVFPVNAN